MSADPAHVPDMSISAEFLCQYALDCGMQRAEVWESQGHPAVFAARLEDPALPTVLVYGHHDVQPAESGGEWSSPPFEMTLRGDVIFGRGVSDDKGQILMHLEVVRELLRERGRLPINLLLIADGEEESGSEHFAAIVRSHRQELAADVAVISDTSMPGRDLPGLSVSARGILYWELRVRTAASDLHSGLYGGAVQNAIVVLSHLLAACRSLDGAILVPSFYDDVLQVSPTDRAALQRQGVDEVAFLEEVGATACGEEGYSTLERRTIRPTLDVCGIAGGYQGKGAKTVVPCEAAAKLSCRLVPNQDPAMLTAKLLSFLRETAPAGTTLELEVVHQGRWLHLSTEHLAVKTAIGVLRDIWGQEPVLMRQGGSIPPVVALTELLQLPGVMLGFSLPSNRNHAPNERMPLEQLVRGIEVLGRLWDAYGTLDPVLIRAPGAGG